MGAVVSFLIIASKVSPKEVCACKAKSSFLTMCSTITFYMSVGLTLERLRVGWVLPVDGDVDSYIHIY